MSRVDRRVDRNRRIHKQSEQNVINSIIRSYFIASNKTIGKVRYYFRFNVNEPILQGFALRRVARMLRSQQGANPKGLSDAGTSENWGNSSLYMLIILLIILHAYLPACFAINSAIYLFVYSSVCSLQNMLQNMLQNLLHAMCHMFKKSFSNLFFS